ncbi:hypothetical protein HYX19_00430 [Candidatus Woesearchaeota archaeon]|nr:hypothetical protein [Candidatus Woesearchaeota archaeon]
MNKGLERKIKKIKKMAVEKEFFRKANLITESLGYSHCISRVTLDEMIYEGEEDIYCAPIYNANGFKIEPDGEFMRIIYKDKIVYEGGPSVKDIGCYIPGEWEKEFGELYLKAKLRDVEIRQRKVVEDVAEAARNKAREEERLKARFGLK